MGVRLRTRAPVEQRREVRHTLRPDLDTPFLAVLMYFPHQPSRAIASDILVGYEPASRENITKIVKTIEGYDPAMLEVVDPNSHSMKALKLLKGFTDTESKTPTRAGVRRKARVISRMAKCR